MTWALFRNRRLALWAPAKSAQLNETQAAELDRALVLRRAARILETTPIRLTDSAAVTLSRATGTAIGRDLVRKIALSMAAACK